MGLHCFMDTLCLPVPVEAKREYQMPWDWSCRVGSEEVVSAGNQTQTFWENIEDPYHT